MRCLQAGRPIARGRNYYAPGCAHNHERGEGYGYDQGRDVEGRARPAAARLTAGAGRVSRKLAVGETFAALLRALGVGTLSTTMETVMNFTGVLDSSTARGSRDPASVEPGPTSAGFATRLQSAALSPSPEPWGVAALSPLWPLCTCSYGGSAPATWWCPPSPYGRRGRSGRQSERPAHRPG